MKDIMLFKSKWDWLETSPALPEEVYIFPSVTESQLCLLENKLNNKWIGEDYYYLVRVNDLSLDDFLKERGISE